MPVDDRIIVIKRWLSGFGPQVFNTLADHAENPDQILLFLCGPAFGISLLAVPHVVLPAVVGVDFETIKLCCNEPPLSRVEIDEISQLLFVFCRPATPLTHMVRSTDVLPEIFDLAQQSCIVDLVPESIAIPLRLGLGLMIVALLVPTWGPLNDLNEVGSVEAASFL